MKPGTRVVCIDASMRPEVAEWQPKHCPNWVRKGAIYTIRQFNNHADVVDGVLLMEIVNPVVYLTRWGRFLEPHFATWRFRELQDPELAIVEHHTELAMAN